METTLPRKLKKDSIAEALCLVRFSAAVLPEIVVGRLADFERWKDFKQSTLPMGMMPSPLRRSDPAMQFEPTLQMLSPDGSRIVRIGERTLSYHVVGVGNYCGWANFRQELDAAIGLLFGKIEGVVASYVGLRYINALTPRDQLVEGLQSLALAIEVAGASVSDFNLAIGEQPAPDFRVLTRIASPSFVVGNFPRDAAIVADVDVMSVDGFSASDAGKVSEWIERAHTAEKTAFFRLFRPDVLRQIVEE